MATVANVADDELITTAWGNSVSGELNSNAVKADGTRVMAAPLTLVGADPTTANHATRKQYVDDQIASRVAITGSTMTGALFAPHIFMTLPQQTAGTALTRKDYVDGQISTYAARQTSASPTGGNCPAGITGLSGTLLIPGNDIIMFWTITWNYQFSGQSTGSEYRVRMINASTGSALAISGWGHYEASKSYRNTFLARIGPIGSSNVLVGFQVEIATSGANTNVSGLAVGLGGIAG